MPGGGRAAVATPPFRALPFLVWQVRAEMAQRIKNHEMRNQARKLTPEQRKEKKRRKMLNDSAGMPAHC